MSLQEILDDYDWQRGATEADFDLSAVESVVGVSKTSGDFAGTNLRGIFRLADGRYAYVFADCDTTRWGCHLSGDAYYCKTLDEVKQHCTSDELRRMGLMQG